MKIKLFAITYKIAIVGRVITLEKAAKKKSTESELTLQGTILLYLLFNQKYVLSYLSISTLSNIESYKILEINKRIQYNEYISIQTVLI